MKDVDECGIGGCDGGWSRPTPLSGPGATGSPGGTHPLAADGDIVHAVWEHWGTLEYRRSEDAGRTWGEIRPVTTGGAAAYPCSLELSDGAAHLIWPEGRFGGWEVWYKRSEDGGETWGKEQRLTPGVNLFRMGTAVSGETLHITWFNNRLVNRTPVGAHTWGEIYYVQSPDGGRSWKPILRLTEPDSTAGRPSVAANGDFVHVIYFDRRESKLDWDWDIFYRRSTDGGTTWEPEVRFTSTPTHARHPQVAADGQGRVCCQWEDGSFVEDGKWLGDAALYACVSEDNGATWGETRRLTFENEPHGQATHAKLYAYGSRLHLTWANTAVGSERPLVPYYMTSPDCGLTWTKPEQLWGQGPGDRYPGGVVGTDSYAIVTVGEGEELLYLRRELRGE